jgi:pantoate--beta-alanine ligase
LRSIATALAAGPGAVAEELARGREALARAGFALDYLEVRDARTLAPIETAIAAPARVFGAVHLGRTRLIDNIPIAAPAVLA